MCPLRPPCRWLFLEQRLAEVQLHFAPIIALKSDGGHKTYVLRRNLGGQGRRPQQRFIGGGRQPPASRHLAAGYVLPLTGDSGGLGEWAGASETERAAARRVLLSQKVWVKEAAEGPSELILTAMVRHAHAKTAKE